MDPDGDFAGNLDGNLDVVTGALSYTGRYLTERLVAGGRRVRTLTFHPQRANPFGTALEVATYRFDDPVALARSLEGAQTLYNTYWVRFERGAVRFDDAVENSRLLFDAARRAGVERIVHVSITNPDIASPLPYFRGKALVERALAESGVPFGIVRPTVVFGREDILCNNIAWLLRRFPVFAVAGRGDYRLRPVHVDDVAALCAGLGTRRDDVVVDAVGPETYTFVEMVESLRDAVGSRARIVHAPADVVAVLARGLSMGVHDVLLTPDELRGMIAGLVNATGPTTGPTSLAAWVADHCDTLGTHYASEVARHYEAPAQVPVSVPA